ncbi:MAG: HAMP domain-containing protein [Bdellovibrionales bacterium]|nr:HAMP domain-containing protein [Bdellovibrionales bacterium]
MKIAMKMQFLTGYIKRKLLFAVTLTLVVATGSVVWISTSLQVKDSRMFMLKSASDMAAGLSSTFAQATQQVLNNARSWVVQSLKDGTQASASLAKFIEGDSSILGIEVRDLATNQFDVRAYAAAQAATLEQLPGNSAPTEGGVQLGYLEASDAVYLRLVSPLVTDDQGKVTKIMIVYLDPKFVRSLFKADGISEALLFDSSGRIFAHSEVAPTDSFTQKNQIPLELLRVVKSNPLTNGQVSLRGGDAGKTFIGSYFKAGVGESYVAVVIDEDRIFETPRRIAFRSFALGLAILSVALGAAVLFGDSLVQPILSLVDAAHRVSAGDFTVRTESKTRDEVHTLTMAFNQMTAGLAEREKLKSVFSKFHSRAVVEKLMSQDKVRLGGERIPVTVFFSDIRSFTNSSEKMAPEEVVEMLNEYMTVMVAVIEKYDGVVDKYVGDAIMAVWGMPTPNPERDAENSVRAALEMREKLVELNKKRIARGQNPIAIGMGLNSGEVIAGNIGSQSRMEYTVIGDTVNTASRMESLTKELKTDFLINESTAKLLPMGVFDLEGPTEAHAKGKAGIVQVYGCKGYLAAAAEEEFLKAA